MGSDNWDPPDGITDPHVLAHRGTLTNVENGYGFVTGGYYEERNLHPSSETLDDTWFCDFIDGREPIVVGCGHYVGG